jgi:hypothetical protein
MSSPACNRSTNLWHALQIAVDEILRKKGGKARLKYLSHVRACHIPRAC